MQKRKYAAVLLILPLFAVTLTVGQAVQVDALNVSTSDGNGGKRFGAITEGQMVGSSSIGDGNGGQRFGATTAHIVCGDRLCSEPATVAEPKIAAQAPVKVTAPKIAAPEPVQKQVALVKTQPHVSVTSVLHENQGWYRVAFKMYSGDSDLMGGKILLTSDISEKAVEFQKIGAGSFVDMQTMIRADSGSSIEAKLLKTVEKYEPAKLVEAKIDPSQPHISLTSVLPENQGWYRVNYKVYAGDKDLTGFKALLTSDISEKAVEFPPSTTLAVPSLAQDLNAGAPVPVSSDFAIKAAGFQKIGAGSFVNMQTNIKADSINSIEAKLVKIVETLAPSISLSAVTPINYASTGKYLAEFMVTAGHEDMAKIRLEIQSDRESFQTIATGTNGNPQSGFLAAQHSALTTVEVLADDPSSITAKIVEYYPV